MGKRYNIAFKGEVADGFTEQDVRSNFVQQFQQDHAVIDRLFSGSLCTLGKNLELARASTAADRLRAIGAVVYLLDENGQIVNESPSGSANDTGIHEVRETRGAR